MLRLSTPNGAHLDAPYHFHSTMEQALDAAQPAIPVHEVPLQWCFQPGVKLDFRHFAEGYVVTAGDVQAVLARIGHTLQPLEIVVINTRAGRDIGYCHIEKMRNLEALPADGFHLSRIPRKIRSASAGWTRAVPIFDEALMAAAR
jgi:kynurenine formamidase